MTITCDNPTTHYGSGCELLLHYDGASDGIKNGIITSNDAMKALSDLTDGRITSDEFVFVNTASSAGSINASCPGCYNEEPFCTPGHRICVGNEVHKCNSAGTAYEYELTCDTGYSCVDGACVKDEEDITCDGQCPQFDGTGCELLLYYDADNNGIISNDERISASQAYSDGEITNKEYMFIMNAYYTGSINALCTGCYTGEAIFRVIEFTAPSSCEAPCNVNIHIKWQNVGTSSGSFIPKYEINSVPYTDPQQTLASNATYTIDDTVSITSAGTYEICPYPNE